MPESESKSKNQAKPSQVFIAADHGGFEAKQALVKALEGEFTIVDLGAPALDPDDDFTPFAEHLAKSVVNTPGSLGILLCRSGEGMAMAANKIDGVRAALAWNEAVAKESRDDNDANILTLPNDYVSADELVEIARAWLTTPFSGETRHQRRIDQITELEDLT